ncbi:hypothetical protein QA601_12940 [Chitinispirillales bacterium ANBcel5]|uniref:hypothetical protein n=1 Tax=Cellulosispirillum alkaliphilum TaxID=3039283 RepID=UPI002A59448D|nr:hypothetical protein [Chitinispirillales bacterium ANBcel5]
MDTMWEKVKRSLKDGASISVEKIEEYTKIGKLKVDEMAAKRKIERNFVDLGERVYELLVDQKGSEVPEDLVVKKCVDNVNSLKDELVQLEKNIKEVSERCEETSKGEEEEPGDA